MSCAQTFCTEDLVRHLVCNRRLVVYIVISPKGVTTTFPSMTKDLGIDIVQTRFQASTGVQEYNIKYKVNIIILGDATLYRFPIINTRSVH